MDGYQKSRKENVNILIIEDSLTQGEKLKFILEDEGFTVEWALSAELGLKYLEKETPTIVISDIMMPEMDGFEFCSRIKQNEHWQHIPIILLTTLSEPGDILKGLDAGADNFITKPYNRSYLLSRIEYLLVNSKLRSVSPKRSPELGIEIYFAGKKHYITSERLQIIDLLFSTYEAIVQKNTELEKSNRQLKLANEKIKTLSGLIPICSNCKKVRNDDGYWQEVEDYVASHTEAGFTHGICNDCMKELYPEFYERKMKKETKEK
ncbi:MAG: response regulator [Candidatus Omnitrophota bacterium]